MTRGVPGAIVDDPNTAAAFSGGFVSIPGGAFNFANNFSLEAWVINNNATAIGRIVANGQPGALGYGLGVLPDGRLRFTTYGILDYDSSVVVPRDGNYHHVVVTFDAGNDATFYLDGVQRQTVLGTLPARSSPFDLTIGRNPVGVLEPWTGNVDEVAVYDYVLSAAQVQGHYQAGITPVPEPAGLALAGLCVAGLAGYSWRRRRAAGGSGS